MNVIHKTDNGRYYAGIPIHAAAGVHEAVAEVIQSRVAKGSTILELGAGSGAMTQCLLDLGYRVLPVDLDASTWKCQHVQPKLLDLNERLWPSNLDGRVFSVITAVEIVEHLENPKQLLRNIGQLLAPGGICIVTTPNVVCANSVNALVRKGYLHGFDPMQYYGSGHISIVPWWLMKLFAEEAGLRVEQTRFVGKLDSPRGMKLAGLRLLQRLLKSVRPSWGIGESSDGVIVVCTLSRCDS